MSLWVYLVDTQPTSQPKMIMMRGGGGSGGSLNGANPIIFMDSKSNTLYLSAATNNTAAATLSGGLNSLITSGSAGSAGVANKASGYVTSVISYLPMQRWVNVMFTISDNQMTTYLDGNMYTVEDLFDYSAALGSRPIFAGVTGDGTIGALPNASPATASVNGYVSRVVFG